MSNYIPNEAKVFDDQNPPLMITVLKSLLYLQI